MISHIRMREVEFYYGDHLLKIQTAKNEGPRLKWANSKFFVDRSWYHLKIKLIAFLII